VLQGQFAQGGGDTGGMQAAKSNSEPDGWTTQGAAVRHARTSPTDHAQQVPRPVAVQIEDDRAVCPIQAIGAGRNYPGMGHNLLTRAGGDSNPL
jgi:hypothetical protein